MMIAARNPKAVAIAMLVFIGPMLGWISYEMRNPREVLSKQDTEALVTQIRASEKRYEGQPAYDVTFTLNNGEQTTLVLHKPIPKVDEKVPLIRQRVRHKGKETLEYLFERGKWRNGG